MLPSRLCMKLLRRALAVLFLDIEMHAAAHHLFQRDTRRFVFLRVDVDSGRRASLQLLAAFCGEDDQTILRINFLSTGAIYLILTYVSRSHSISPL